MDQGQYGRVTDDGTVYVKVGETELEVGQYPEGTPDEALAFFTRRGEGIAFEVQLLEQRVRSAALSPDEAQSAIDQIVEQLAEPRFVADVVGLRARLDALRPLLGQQRQQRREDRARKVEEAKGRKEQIVTEAEKIANGRDWRHGANRLRDLLTEWKALPRLDKATDDALWHRFSAARTAHTKARKALFSEVGQQRTAAKAVKEKLIAQAEELSSSTEWGPTSGAYRALMQDWKAAGSAPREVEEKLWQRFRAAQDVFFAARDAANAEQDKEFAANAEVKRSILASAEELLPVTDLDAAKRAFRDLAEKWDAAGKVPRDQIKPLEGAFRKVEQAIRAVEDDQWKRTDPEKSARADDMVGQLRAGVAALEADLEAARSAGDARRVSRLEEDLSSKRAFLEMAEKAARDFS